MAEWRRQGLCFNCNEKYSRGHNRFYKRIFFLESVEIDDDEADAAAEAGDQAAPVFSLHAVADVPYGGTMQLAVIVVPPPLSPSSTAARPTTSSPPGQRDAQG
jgi:hypothetical protein